MGWNDRHDPSHYSTTTNGLQALHTMTHAAPMTPDDEDMLMLVFADEIEAEYAARKADR